MKTMIRNMAIVMLLVQGGLSAVVGKVGGKVVTGGSDAAGVSTSVLTLTPRQLEALTPAEKVTHDKAKAQLVDLKAKARTRRSAAGATNLGRTEKDGFPIKAVKAK